MAYKKKVDLLTLEKVESITLMRGGRFEHEQYFPEQYDKHIGEGAWIQVIYPPPTLIYVHYLGIYYAVPFPPDEINYGQFVTEERGVIKPYKVKILTPQGEVALLPYEYNIVKDVYGLLGEADKEKDMTINWLSPRNEHYDTDVLHYIMSRGISKQEAMKILLGDVKSQSVCYLTFSKRVQKFFAGTGVPTLSARSVCLEHIKRKPLSDEEVARLLEEEKQAEIRAEEEKKENARKLKEARARNRKFSKMLSGLKF